MKNNKEIERARTEAVAALVWWAKTRVGYFPMRSAVNIYMEAIGANRMPVNGEEWLIAHRKIAAQGLAIECDIDGHSRSDIANAIIRAFVTSYLPRLVAFCRKTVSLLDGINPQEA